LSNGFADAQLLVQGEVSTEEVDVVKGAVKSNQANNKPADELEAALNLTVKKPAPALTESGAPSASWPAMVSPRPLSASPTLTEPTPG
jgi:hypothetical protein